MLNKLINAIQIDDARTVSVLLEAGVNPNDVEDSERITPLHFVAQRNTADACHIARLLLDAGADPAARTAVEGHTPYDVAQDASSFNMVDILRGQTRKIPKNIFQQLTVYNTEKRKEQEKLEKPKTTKNKKKKPETQAVETTETKE